MHVHKQSTDTIAAKRQWSEFLLPNKLQLRYAMLHALHMVAKGYMSDVRAFAPSGLREGCALRPLHTWFPKFVFKPVDPQQNTPDTAETAGPQCLERRGVRSPV